jgi:ribose transport system substrate-binding protein
MNRIGKRVFAASMVAATLVMLAGCERHSKSEEYYLVATNTKLAYWQTAAAGLAKAASEYGVTAELRGPDGLDKQGEVTEFRTVVAKNPAGILVSVADTKLMQPEIDAALTAGIPVITIDSDAPQSHRLYFIGTNNLQAGRLGGERVVSRLNGKGNVVFFSNPGQPNLDERLKGYKDVFADHPGIKVVEVFNMNGDSGTAMDKAEEYLARKGNDKIDAFVCLEAAAGKDVAEGFKRQKATDRLLVAMDADEATLKLVQDGTIDSTIAQKPYTMALLGLKGLDDIHHYPVKPLIRDTSDALSPFPSFVDTGVALVDKASAEFYMPPK